MATTVPFVDESQLPVLAASERAAAPSPPVQPSVLSFLLFHQLRGRIPAMMTASQMSPTLLLSLPL